LVDEFRNYYIMIDDVVL